MKKAVLLIMDGLGDLPTPKTPLQMAKKPNLDNLAKKGETGLISTIERGVIPGSDTSHLQLFGYDPALYYPGRGPLEALGIGIKLKNGDIAFRTNFATAKGKDITDRRAGRIDTSTARKLEYLLNMRIEDVNVIFKSSVEHRGALVLRGKGLSPDISDTDTHFLGPMQECKPLGKSKSAAKTARIVNKFIKQARKRLDSSPVNKKRKLPANFVLLRGAGSFREIPSMEWRYNIKSACVAGGALYKGVSRYVGMDVPDVKGATGDKNTSLKAKGKAVVNALKTHDFVFVHVKATDSFSHDGDAKGKAGVIGKVDRELIPILKKTGAYLVITGDHSTPCLRKAHSGHEVPILIYGKDERIDSVKKFDEMSCMNGGIGHIIGKDLIHMILNLIEKAEVYGS